MKVACDRGELLKLGFEVAQSSVAKYMVRRCGPPSQGWRTFLRNHAPDIAAMDLFVVPTIGFELLYILVIVRLARRDLVWINVTSHPTAEWVTSDYRGIPLERAPALPDPRSGSGLRRCRHAPIASHGHPRQAHRSGLPLAERLRRKADWMIRRECVDHVVVWGEAHLRRILRKYSAYYNELRTHRSLDKDAPIPRAIQHVGCIISSPVLGGLHHRYCRI